MFLDVESTALEWTPWMCFWGLFKKILRIHCPQERHILTCLRLIFSRHGTSKIVKQLKRFPGRVSYNCKFVPALPKVLQPFLKLLKKDMSFKSSKKQHVAFQRVKHMLGSSLTMILPMKCLPLYLTSINKSIEALLAQEVEGVENSIYCLSRLL